MKRKNDFWVNKRLTAHFGAITKICKLDGDASRRSFYRFISGGASMIAMVYPEADTDEIERIKFLNEVYRKSHLNVPLLVDELDGRILIVEDIGDVSLQEHLSKASSAEKKHIWEQVGAILSQLKEIPVSVTQHVLDINRMEVETDFFIANFAGAFFRKEKYLLELKEEILFNLKKINTRKVFAHRDFHSRNIHLHNGKLYLIDFQDSLRAPEYYDAVSFIFDSYTDDASTHLFLEKFLEMSGSDPEQVYLTAYQRNIKALGTFGFQVKSGKKKFKRYIEPTIRKIRKNLIFKDESALGSFFLKIEKMDIVEAIRRDEV